MPKWRVAKRKTRKPKQLIKLPGAAVPSVLATPTLTAGWATFGVPLAQGDLPSGQALKVGSLATQTDVVTTWPDGSAKLALVTCKPTGTATLDVAAGAEASGTFAPTVPTAVATFTVYHRFGLLGDFSVTSGTLKVVLRNAAGGGAAVVADAILIEAVDAGGTPTGTTYVVDNADGSPAYTESGTWGNGGSGYKSGANHGWGDSTRVTTDNAATATWQKTGLASGTYRVSAAWSVTPAEATFGSNSTQKAGYEVFDNTTSRGEIFYAQFWDSGEVGGTTLGDYSITSGTCNVRLGNDVAVAGTMCLGERVALYLNGALVAVKGYNDSGVTTSGAFAASSGYAAAGDSGLSNVAYVATGSVGGTAYTQWQFTGLASGTYRVVAWGPWSNGSDAVAVGLGGYPPFATDAPWTVLDNATSRGTVDVDQTTPAGRAKAVTYTATLSGSVGSDLWLNGALVQEWRRYQAPVDGGSVAHPALLCIWDVRCFSDGTCRLQLAVENSYHRAGVREVGYDVTVTVNGSTAFTESGLEHFPGCRWTKVFAAAGLSESTVTPDFARAHSSAAKLLPKYASSAAYSPGSIGQPSGGNARWKVLRPGGILHLNMYTGDVSYVGPYPAWVSDFLANGGSREYMLETARNSMAAYPAHFRDPADNLILSPATYVNLWADPRNASVYTLADYASNSRYAFRRQLYADGSHQPAAVYVAYLLTGERYLADEMAHWCAFNQFGFSASTRGGASMILQGVEPRAMGWTLRNTAEAAALLPDAHEAKGWAATAVANTLGWYDDYAAGSAPWAVTGESFPASSPVAFCPYYAPGDTTDVGSGEKPQVTANWQVCYALYGVQRSRDLGLVSASAGAAAVTRLTAFSLGQFGGQQAGGSESDPAVSTWPRDGNLLVTLNSGFDGVCTDDANYAKDWTVQTGTAGTHVVVGSRAESYGCLGCLKLVSDGSTLASVYQEFNKARSDLANAGGTEDTLTNSLSYYLVTWMKISSTDSTGTVILELVDGSGTVHNSNQFTTNVSSLTTSYARKVFTVTTATLPGTYRLRIRFGSSPTSGRSVYLSPVAMYRVPSSGNRQLGTGFYGSVGFNQASTITYASTWDQMFAVQLAAARSGNQVWPSSNNFPEHALILNISERLGLSGATAAYDACLAHPSFFWRENFKLVRGMYA